jgi:hypothetical protein
MHRLRYIANTTPTSEVVCAGTSGEANNNTLLRSKPDELRHQSIKGAISFTYQIRACFEDISLWI